MAKFKITNYSSMGRPAATITFEGTLGDAMRKAERFPALCSPGSGRGAAPKARVTGIVRLPDEAK